MCYGKDMPRTARIFQRAICYHLMNRGLNRTRIFEDDAGKKWFSDAIKDYKEICGANVYHWVWMDTHWHMLAEVVYDNLRGFVTKIGTGKLWIIHWCHSQPCAMKIEDRMVLTSAGIM